MTANLLLTTSTSGVSGSAGIIMSMLPMLAIIVVFYFLLIRPQKKQQQQHDLLISGVEAGDSVVTTSGFYGVVIDVMDEIVIVEFGNNKNCRIPMKRDAIVDIEKPEDAKKAVEAESSGSSGKTSLKK